MIGQQFCGPPNSGNGGYVCGVLAKDIDGPATSVLRARVPLDVELHLETENGALLMTDADGALVGKSQAASGAELPTPPEPPSLEAARAAGRGYVGLEQRFHPICFTCGPERHEGDGLRVFAGQIEGAPLGHLAGVWTPHAAFADAAGLATTEVVWAALDCPGYFAWVAKEGRHGALLGTMTGEVLRRPRVGEACIVTAWPLAREGRKELAGVALFSATGELMARGHQVWIVMGPPAPAVAEAPATASA
ncbi:hypothetical protein DJ021_00460 [Phenylobacterium hankyongense]|uniref:Thioesterase family protein n=2 Tax=Phenylobacterium hankyongense TaxID=1813876 RepID=A0A328AUT2_9CAUL|nr:hypothetical protein DJ021_00460 [Phenylobacterium hankyongense]